MPSKDKFYFDHDYNARNDDKIMEMRSEYGAQGYGVFWMIVETMVENDNGGLNKGLMGGLSHGYGVAKDWLIPFVEYCIKIDLFFEKEGIVYSERALIHKEFRRSLSEAGTAGAKKRWGGYSHPNAKERIGKDRKKMGVEFSADGLKIIFDDKTERELTLDEKRCLKEGALRPHYIKE